jgi:hypothetical protein
LQTSAGNFSRIIVYDRASHRLVEEQISATLVLAMRNMYQSKVGVDDRIRASVSHIRDVTQQHAAGGQLR